MNKGLRKHAEEMLSTDTARKPLMPTKDVKKLVHELQVNQIELELQNEELRQAQIELAGSRDRYLALYDHAPVGYLTIDHNDLITECNLTTAAMLGLNRIKITGKQKLSHFVAREAQKEWFSFKRGLSSTAVIQKGELEMHEDNGNPFFVHLEGKAAVMDGTGEKRILITLTDITKRKFAEQKIEHHERELFMLTDNAPDLIFRIDRKMRHVFVNQRVLELTGRKQKDYLGHTNRELGYPTELCELLENLFQQVFEKKKPQEIRFTFESPLGPRNLHMRVVPEFTKDEEVETIMGITRDITERKQAEDMLRKSEEKLKSLYSSMNEGLAVHEIVCDNSGNAIDYRILDVNPSFEIITGIKRERAIGQLASELYSTGRPPYIDTYAKVADTGVPVKFETTFEPMGRNFHISAFSPGKGTFATVFNDITEQKRLQRRVEYLARFPAENPNPVLRVLAEGILKYANPAADKIIQAWKTKVGRKVPTLWQERINAAIDDGRTAMYELEIDHDTYAAWIAPFTKHKYANLYLHQITDLKQSHVREKRSAMLAAASKMSLDTVDAMKEGIVLLKMDGTIKSINRGLIELSGYSRDFFEGEYAAQLIPQLMDKEHVHEAVQALTQAIQGKVSQLDEIILIGKEGDRIPVLINTVFIKDEDGKPETIVVTIQDITEVKKAEIELRALASELVLAEEQERKHLAVSLHDTINQTLALAKIKLGALNQMLDSKAEQEAMQEIRELFSLAVEQTRTLSFELSPPILYELGLQAAVEWLGEKMKEEYKFEFSLEGPSNIGPLEDHLKILMFQSIRELLTNIGKHAGARHVKVAFIPENKKLTVVVEDDGKGFDFTAVRTRRNKQSGIGLFSIKDRMRHLGGSFQVDSVPGKGTAITISAPLQNPQS